MTDSERFSSVRKPGGLRTPGLFCVNHLRHLITEEPAFCHTVKIFCNVSSFRDLIIIEGKIQSKERDGTVMRKRVIGQWILVSLMIGITGCGRTQDIKTEGKMAAEASELSANTGKNDSADYVTGQGFRPPQDSHVDKNGNIVDREGNIYDKEGKWQVPEGGRVDSQGRIYDKNGDRKSVV